MENDEYRFEIKHYVYIIFMAITIGILSVFTLWGVLNLCLPCHMQEENATTIISLESNPTYEQIKEILAEDRLDEQEDIFDEKEFNCVEYSYYVVQLLRKNNIYSCITELNFIESHAHANVAVNTSDYGVVYIEPQDDEMIIGLSVGQNYCEQVKWDVKYNIICPDSWEITHIKDCFKEVKIWGKKKY